MTITKRQLDLRRQALGGSDAPVLVGASPWKTPLALWLEKRGVSTEESEPSLAMEVGTALEAYVAERWSRDTGLAISEVDTMIHPLHSFLIGHPDRMLAQRNEGLEVKVVGAMTDEWGPGGSDQVPLYVHIQCDHYLMVSGAERWHVAALFGMRELRHYIIERDAALLAKLTDKEVEFWRMVIDGVQPPMMNAADARRLFPLDAGTTAVATPEIADAIRQLQHLRSELADYENMEQHTVGLIQMFMQDAATLVSPTGEVLATWKTARPSEKLDVKRLIKECPDLSKRYTFFASGIRRFILKGARNDE